MRVGIGFNTDISVEQATQYAALADEFGFDSFWLHENSFSRDALSYLYSAARAARKIKLGAGCVSAYTRHPVVLAMSFYTLHEMSANRGIMGLGTGFPMRLDLLGIDHSKPVGALKECAEICRRLWRGETVTMKGRQFSLKNVRPLTGKVQVPIPIYIAAWKTQMLRLTGKVGDGYIAKGGESVKSLKRIMTGIDESAANAKRSMDLIDIAGYLLTAVSSSRELAIQIARKDPFVCYMLSVQDDYLYEESGIDPALKRPIAENYFKGNVSEAQAHITEEMLSTFALAGTADDVCDRVKEYVGAGLKLPILQPISSRDGDVKAVLETGRTLAA
jgi:alkanesulfonate monooxygenase SsuD/methylene tetrahydromethanopterin reductase-like flavin-dependent oxidoreductase (luciferase family)